MSLGRVVHQLKRVRVCQRAATAVEYGLIVSLIVIAMMTALGTVADKTTSMWGNVTNAVIAH
ncbi:pilus assembly protein Flp/PilA [Sphingobium subterraneum]|uniref:Pilus assembly protein Flp/PilA n=2 Tax=Sphingobium subterraneum TaxID=627688 RepID=A0A841IWE5_9SPHN|nr:Flp family type IVb pilin [Sphingobium subterraneum]MBB6122590.1 pilus assembly protein Flp/PilA [Sphingobium subterraneum]